MPVRESYTMLGWAFTVRSEKEAIRMDEGYKEVDFMKYCKLCAYGNQKETDEPCDECLSIPFNTYSHKPVYWKEKE